MVDLGSRAALPGWAIDLIRDGVRNPGHTDRDVWLALGRTALSAINHGWPSSDWEYLILEPKSRLGLQARTTSRGKTRTPAALSRSLTGAWKRAEKHAAATPEWNTQNQLNQRLSVTRTLAADADAPLSDSQRAVLDYAADVAEEVGSTVVNLPRRGRKTADGSTRGVAEGAGIGERAARNALARLSERGILRLSQSGRPGTVRPRANAYELPGPDVLAALLSRETRQVGPPNKTGGTPTSPHLGTPHETGGTPQPERDDMPHIPDEDRAAVLALLSDRAAARNRQHEAGHEFPITVRTVTRRSAS